MSRKNRISQKIKKKLCPTVLIINDESINHNNKTTEETHFKLTIVSNYFINISLINRHKIVKKILLEEFNNGLHALSLSLYTEYEWKEKNKKY